MLTEALWKTQSMLHSSDSKTLPALLLLSAGSLVVYRHCTAQEWELQDGGDNLRTFLALIVLQMLPLIFLEVKILTCPDPISLLGKFGTKVMLMHSAFLALHAFVEHRVGSFNFIALILSFVVLKFGFNLRLSLASAWQHRDVGLLIVLAFTAAVLTEMVDVLFVMESWPPLSDLCSTTSDYLEILAFVPAVWSVARAHMNMEADFTVSTVDPRRQSLFFFAFVGCLYFHEDVLNGACAYFFSIPLAAGGHMVHFLLLLDFAGFILAHIYNPDNLKGKLLRWLPDACVPEALFV